MAKYKDATLTMKVDERSIRTFKRNVDAVISAVGEYAKEDIMDFCEDVLYDANLMVPIDTGTLARSAGYKVKSQGKKKGYTARMGYGIFRNPTNPRTGKTASSYAAIVHEDMGQAHDNGEAKFFEKALYKHVGAFYRANKESLQSLLVGQQIKAPGKAATFKSEESKEKFLKYQRWKTSGFTAQHKGKILPYPLGGKVPTGRKATKKTAHSERTYVSTRFMRKKYRAHYAYQNRNTPGSYGSHARYKAHQKKKYGDEEQMKQKYNQAYAESKGYKAHRHTTESGNVSTWYSKKA